MNKKYIFPFLLLVVAGTAVTGCEKAVTPVPNQNIWYGEIKQILSNDQFINLNVGESQQLSITINPSNAKLSKVNYRIEEGGEAIASVSPTGVVTAKKMGKTYVICESDTNDEVNFRIPVEVFAPASYEETVAFATLQHLAKCDESGKVVVTPDTFEIREKRTVYHSVEGKPFDGYQEWCNYNISMSEAYLSFGGYEESINCVDGAKEGTNYLWSMMTDENYISYGYHMTDNVKNRVTLATQAWMDDPTKTRFDVCRRIVDTMFRNGSKVIVDQNYDTADGEGAYDDLTRFRKYITSTSMNDDSYEFTLVQSGIADVVSRETADNTGIAEGTPMIINIIVKNKITNGFCTSEYVWQEYVYEKDGLEYRYLIELNDAIYFDDEVSYVAPVDKEYTQVKELFDL